MGGIGERKCEIGAVDRSQRGEGEVGEGEVRRWIVLEKYGGGSLQAVEEEG